MFLLFSTYISSIDFLFFKLYLFISNIYTVKRIKNFSSFIFESVNLTPEIEEVLNKCVIGTWKLVDGKIDVDGDFTAYKAKNFFDDGSILPLKFGKITGGFDVSELGLKTLEGCPEETGIFNCSQNLLDSLEFGPAKAKDYYCSNNYLNSLEGISENWERLNASGNNIENLKVLGNRDSVSGDVILYNNLLLKNLDGCPKKVGKSLDISNCDISSLEGCPQEVGKNFNCENNNLRSLEGGPRIVLGFYDCSKNKLSDLIGCAENPKWIDASYNKLISIEGAPKNWSRSNLSFNDNFLPDQLLKFQYDFINASKGNELDWKSWLIFLLDNDRNTKEWTMDFFNNKKFVGDRTTEILEIAKRSKLDELSHEEPEKLAALTTMLDKKSPLMDYILRNRNKFSKQFIEDLETSTDLKDLGF